MDDLRWKQDKPSSADVGRKFLRKFANYEQVAADKNAGNRPIA